VVKPTKSPPRNLTIDTVRGFACILLVAYHVVGSEPTNGLLIADGPYRIIADLLAFVRMPLFTFISGYVYAWRPYRGKLGTFLSGKARRLLIPMFVVGSLFVLSRSLTPGTNVSREAWYLLHLLHLLPVEHFWFVESLFILFLLLIPLEVGGLLKTPRRFLGIFIPVLLIYLSGVEFAENYFSINGALYLLPFFLGGLACSRFALHAEKQYPLLWIALLLPYAYVAVRMQSLDWLLDRRSLPALWIGLLSSFLLVRSDWQERRLAHVGHFSYSIYLFHVFFTAASRIFLHNLHLFSVPLLFVTGLIAGIVGPILLDRIASAHWLSAMLLLGKKLHHRVQPARFKRAAPLIEVTNLPPHPSAE